MKTYKEQCKPLIILEFFRNTGTETVDFKGKLIEFS